jgi:hypothetical protein
MPPIQIDEYRDRQGFCFFFGLESVLFYEEITKIKESEEARRADRALEDSIIQQFMILNPQDDENSPSHSIEISPKLDLFQIENSKNEQLI